MFHHLHLPVMRCGKHTRGGGARSSTQSPVSVHACLLDCCRRGAGAIIGLLLIGLGTGGIKPCVAAFGGDQIGKNQAHLLEVLYVLPSWCSDMLSYRSVERRG